MSERIDTLRLALDAAMLELRLLAAGLAEHPLLFRPAVAWQRQGHSRSTKARLKSLLKSP